MTPTPDATQVLPADAERLQLFIAGVTDYAIYMLSPSGEITNWYSGAARIKGYRQEEVVGSNFSRFYTAEDQAAGAPSRALAIAARESRFEGEGWRVRKDGTQFWAHVVIDPIRIESGELIGFGKVTRDTTELRDAAQALERAKEALFQAQKLEALGKLAGGVAHDFNNLLSVIVSGLEIISKEVQTPASVRTLSGMQRAASRGAVLTQQLLSFARQQPLPPEKSDQLVASVDSNASAERALVVDDQPDVLETMVELLKTMGYEVLSASSGAEALRILDRQAVIHVLLSDVVMAGMDGVTLGREARKRCPGIKVILASGFPRDNFKEQSADMAPFGFLTKPFRMAELAKLLRQGE